MNTAFVPYILMTRDDVKPTDAIKISKQETMGYKGKMFGAASARRSLLGAFLVFTLLGKIPYLGVLFRILWVLIAIAYGLLAPLFSGIMQAAFYVEIREPAARQASSRPAPAQPVPPVIPAPASEPETQPAPQGEPVVTAQEPEAPAQPEPEQGVSGTAAINGTALPALRRTRQNAGRSVLHCLRKETGMSIVLFILALAAAFIGTIFAFRAVHRIHNGESYTYESHCLRRLRDTHRACADAAIDNKRSTYPFHHRGPMLLHRPPIAELSTGQLTLYPTNRIAFFRISHKDRPVKAELSWYANRYYKPSWNYYNHALPFYKPGVYNQFIN